MPNNRSNTMNPPNGPSVQSSNGPTPVVGSTAGTGFRYSHTTRPIQPPVQIEPMTAMETRPRVRRPPIFSLSRKKLMKMAPRACMRLNMTALRERVRTLK